MKILFVYNPKAGKGKIRNNLLDIIDVFAKANYDITVHPTQRQGDAIEIVKNRERNLFDMIVCSGGDGTLDEVVTGMLQCDEKLPIGYIPAGSTNDFARTLDISSNMVEAATEIVNGKIFPCDVGQFNDDAFVYVAAFGLFTEVSYATDQNLKNMLGHVAYILEGAKSLASIKTYKMTFESEGMVIDGEYIYGMVTNSTSVGGFKNLVAKDVELNDGKFEVVLVKKPSNVVELNEIILALVQQHYNCSCIQSFKTSKIVARSEEEVSWTLDGEFGGNHKEVDIVNIQNAISLMVKNEED